MINPSDLVGAKFYNNSKPAAIYTVLSYDSERRIYHLKYVRPGHVDQSVMDTLHTVTYGASSIEELAARPKDCQWLWLGLRTKFAKHKKKLMEQS